MAGRLEKPIGARQYAVRRLLAIATLLAALCGLVFLYFNNPSRTPVTFCVLNALTGLYCPGCGNTRALYHLLHGDIAAAMGMNAFFVCAIVPLGIWLALSHGIKWMGFNRYLPLMPIKPLYALAFAGVMVLFGVLRNVPAFIVLAPG